MKSLKKYLAKRSKHSRTSARKKGVFPSIVQKMHLLTLRFLSLLWKNKLLSVIMIIGLFLRLLGTNPGYPQIHSDEPSIQEATRILVMYHKYDPQNYYYGSLLSIIYAFFILVVGIPLFFFLVLTKDWHIMVERGFFGFLDYFFNIVANGSNYFDTFYNFFPYWTRYETAILSSFASIVVYLLVKRLFSKGPALIAAFLTAINYRHVLSSTLTLADGPAAVFATLSILLSTKLLQNPTRKNYLIAGFGLGCALSVKYFIYVFPAFFLCHFLAIVREKKVSLKAKLSKLFLNKNLIVSLLLAGVIFVLINPYLFLNHKEASLQMHVNSARYGLEMQTVLEKFKPPFTNLISKNTPYPFWYLYRFGYGEILSIAIALGFAYAGVRYKKQSLIIGSVVIPFFFVFAALSGNTPVRNYAVITPLLLIFPSVLVYDLARKIKQPQWRKAILILLVLIVGYQTFKNSLLSSFYASLPLNYTQSFVWMNQHLKENAVIAKTPGAFVQKEHTGIPILGNYTGVGASLAELKDQKVEYVIIASPNTTLSNMLAWIVKTPDDYSYYDEKRQWELMNNTYVTLVLRDLAQYTVARFYKPYWQSLEPSLLIIQLPSFWGEKKGQLISAYDISTASCTDYLKQSTKVFPVHPGDWYTITGKGIWKTSLKTPSGSGFLRLDFYAKDKRRITTSVSQLLSTPNILTTLTTASFAPTEAASAKVSLQIDTCLRDERYSFNGIHIYEAKQTNPSKYVYPYREDDLAKNFIWLPEIL
ncbi:MAG: phospholipid carrier-dependent glycosyltransferase [Candidatus Levybacteria bacterium]|nr:phospholipid carrier-dependent glycosyltransferase [Candidatus Levybacteria bacterium]